MSGTLDNDGCLSTNLAIYHTVPVYAASTDRNGWIYAFKKDYAQSLNWFVKVFTNIQGNATGDISLIIYYLDI